ncbi:DUF1552 domain-containing protein [Halioxenophilus sp. WMMB6]|uniref:DUF1552 domain-containing protein n=1 Tax=Halioxenophilus sp. WMMB6 TaxID=3073815 RepID=UPI00295F2E52|nr:DUF1552 domain-containing protein [Halioxenophilus sp. WMMB6]
MTKLPSINRRTFLRGVGATIALPAMESLLPNYAQAAQGAKRLSVFYIPNGLRMPMFTPAEVGANYALTPLLQPLAQHRQSFSVITGLAHYNANALGDGPGSHGRSCGAYLTGAHPKRTEGADIYCGISMDQVAANAIGQSTQLASLELGIEPPSLLGSCDVGYSCTYTNTLSWRSPTAPMPVTVKPRDAFERLFGDSGLDEQSRQQRLATKASILDFVMADAARLSPRLGANDRRKLEEYMESIRAVEKRIEKASAQSADIDTGNLVLPAGLPNDFEEHVHLMIDLQVLALQSDMTRVVTFMMGRELSNRAYPEIGVPDSHHSLSHHGEDPAKVAKLIKINQLHLQQFGYLLERLSNTADGEGSLLDTTLVFGGASLGEPNAHDNMDLPALVAGGGIAGNRHLALAKDTPMCNLMLTLLQGLGVPAEQFGDSSANLPQLFS